MIFLSGSPVMESKGNILTGRLSGIVNHHIPAYLRGNQLPTYTTNCIEDWEHKVDRIVDETVGEDMALISGIPPWMLMYFERLMTQAKGKTVGEIFKNLQVIIYGGVNFDPYRNSFLASLGRPIDTIETYPASEGFIAYEAKGISVDGGLLLNTNSGIFFEFVTVDSMQSKTPERVMLIDVKLDVNYAIILNSNAGLWGYVIGDTVRFTSLNPYLIKVTGRLKHFISAFGEHVIGEEVDAVMQLACEQHKVSIVEFHVAPNVQPESGLPYHEWFIEFAALPSDMDDFANTINNELSKKNIYYDDLIQGGILKPCVVSVLPKNSFNIYMDKNGKLGGQNKVPRLMNDRGIADELSKFI
jgi:hypothetical protein